MTFIPKTPKDASAKIIYFEEARREDGWQGHTTGKSIEKLKAEIAESIRRLGGLVTAFVEGDFMTGEVEREGFRVKYTIEASDGSVVRGHIDVAALPVKNDWKMRNSLDKRRESSLKMALYMLREALDGTWFLQQLSPGYAPLMPWIEDGSGKTLTEFWAESPAMKRLLPPTADGEIIEGEVS